MTNRLNGNAGDCLLILNVAAKKLSDKKLNSVFYVLDFGVDYVANSYGCLLEIMLRYQEMTNDAIQNLLPLEMLQNLLTKYTPQLRENINNFFVLV